jgi:hypothetical protein
MRHFLFLGFCSDVKFVSVFCCSRSINFSQNSNTALPLPFFPFHAIQFRSDQYQINLTMDPMNQQAQVHDANVSTIAQNQCVVSVDGSAQAAMRNAQMLPNQVPPHLMGLMTNPALAAAAAAANMLSNPAAFLALPNGFGMQQAAGGAGVAAQGGIVHNIRVPMNNPLSVASVQANVTPIAPMGTMAMPLAPASSSSVLSNRTDVFTDDASKARRTDHLSADERARQNRDRNREHARSTRLRKKAYVQKLKELVEGLHAERTEEVRQRRVAIQHLSEMQNVRRAVVRTFLRLHSNYETDDRKWRTILEENFWLKQPVTPYRSFRRAEIEQVRITFSSFSCTIIAACQTFSDSLIHSSMKFSL